MSEFEIRQLQERIDAGVLLAQKRLIERTKRENGDLVVIRDGKIMHLRPDELRGVSDFAGRDIFRIFECRIDTIDRQTL